MDVTTRRFTKANDAAMLSNLLSALRPNKKQSIEVDDLRVSQIPRTDSTKKVAMKMKRGNFTEFMPTIDDGAQVLEGYLPNLKYFYELGYKSSTNRLTVASLGGISKLPLYNPTTKTLNAVTVNGETVSQTGWDASVDMVRFTQNSYGLKQVWFEMEKESCGILMKNNDTPASNVRLIENFLHKQTADRSSTVDLALYEESCEIVVDGTFSASNGHRVQLRYAESDAADQPAYEQGDIVAEGNITNINGQTITVAVTGGEFVHDTAAYDLAILSTLVKTSSVGVPAVQYNMQLYMLVKDADSQELKYIHIKRDDMMNQKNDTLDGSLDGVLSLQDVLDDLVDFGERAEDGGDALSNDAPLFVIRQNHFTTVGSNDEETSESSAWGDPFIMPIID
jgi:hypothetical protein